MSCPRTLREVSADVSRIAVLCRAQICGLPIWQFRGKQVFRVKKLVGRRWGAPNSNYLLVMVSTFVMPFSMDPLSPRMTPGCIMQK